MWEMITSLSTIVVLIALSWVLFVVLPTGTVLCCFKNCRKMKLVSHLTIFLVGPLVGFSDTNCQGWAQRVRDKYWQLLEDPKVSCECKTNLQIVR